MIYVLRGLYDLVCEVVRPTPQPQPAGQWWFDSQESIDWGPALATVAEYHGDDDGYDEDGKPLPADTGRDRPRCKSCKGPNFSLDNKLCIACRIGIG